MAYPVMVYKGIGPFQREHGTYDYKTVGSDDEYNAAIADGWFPSLPEAIDGFLNDKTPPTRAEMEAKATELGIPFTARTKDAKLLKLINDFLAPDDATETTEATTSAATTETVSTEQTQEVTA